MVHGIFSQRVLLSISNYLPILCSCWFWLMCYFCLELCPTVQTMVIVSIVVRRAIVIFWNMWGEPYSVCFFLFPGILRPHIWKFILSTLQIHLYWKHFSGDSNTNIVYASSTRLWYWCFNYLTSDVLLCQHIILPVKEAYKCPPFFSSGRCMIPIYLVL